MRQLFKEWWSLNYTKNPGKMILVSILLFNVVFVLGASFLISRFALTGTEHMGFLRAAFCTVTMILDAGCIQFVVEDIGTSGVGITVLCLFIIFTGMVTFTGAVIGYVTNTISDLISNVNAGNMKIHVSNHFVILNWNTRASEIVNDLLYYNKKSVVVVLVKDRRNEIVKEIQERLQDTVARENADLKETYREYSYFKRKYYERKYKFKQNVTVIVREGNVFSSKQLSDISLSEASSVVILENEDAAKSSRKKQTNGNADTIKILMQVADITASDYSLDNQKIIVEISDDQTLDAVKRIIKNKQVDGKCNIVPVPVNQILGQLLSQFSIMPELNLAYKELFSNKGAAFYSYERAENNQKTYWEDNLYIADYLSNHKHAIPLSSLDCKGKNYFYFSAASEQDIMKETSVARTSYSVSINYDYWLERKNVVIVGHNSKIVDIMRGFDSFRAEWKKRDEEILHIIVIDDEEHLEKMNYYRDYPYVEKTVKADVFDKEDITNTIKEFAFNNKEDTSILILSDDNATSDNVDGNTLTNLIYIQDIINERKEEYPDFDEKSLDIVVEIIDPKHYDILRSYSVDNVVISNRYISKMITQIGEKEALFDFYKDILTYDEEGLIYDSKEIYVKKVSSYFTELPKKATYTELIRAVFEQSSRKDLPNDKRNPAIVLGYVRQNGEIVLFSDNQDKNSVQLCKDDKIIVFTNH